MQSLPRCVSYLARHISRGLRVCLFFSAASFIFLSLQLDVNPVTDGSEALTADSWTESGAVSKDAISTIRRASTNISNSTVSASQSVMHRPDYKFSGNIPSEFHAWMRAQTKMCDEKVEFYSWSFGRFLNFTIDPKYCVAAAKGGLELDQALMQEETAEYHTIDRNCFQISCVDKLSSYTFYGNNYFNDWLKNVTNSSEYSGPTELHAPFTIALQRKDYANLYWTVNDWYMTFLMMTFFNKSADETNILLIDAHPIGKVDAVWSVLFNSSRQLGQIENKVLFKDLVWGIPSTSSILLDDLRQGQTPPLLNEFRDFFLSRYHVDASRDLDCARMSVLFIWRRDYVAHPRNPKGVIQRKIDNEQELLDGIKQRHPAYKVQGVQLDHLSMKEQLELTSQADILIGMHGAGLAHALLLQPHAAVIELVPSFMGNNDHFTNLARWRGISYIRWINTAQINERPNFSTYVPVQAVDEMITTIVNHRCVKEEKRIVSEPLFLNWSLNRAGVAQFLQRGVRRVEPVLRQMGAWPPVGPPVGLPAGPPAGSYLARASARAGAHFYAQIGRRHPRRKYGGKS